MANRSDAVTDERRVAIVTGAGGTGCGRAIAVRFSLAGAAVIVSDVEEAGGRETMRLIEDCGGRARN
jgi:NAD(P)-dependent dehydrogenase (short-subunit alcohol dehydrogenase family)